MQRSRVDDAVGATDEEVARARNDLDRALRPRRDLVVVPRSAARNSSCCASTRCFGPRVARRPRRTARRKRNGGAMPTQPAMRGSVDRERDVGAERPADQRRAAPSRRERRARRRARRRTSSGFVAAVAVRALAALDAAEVEAQAARSRPRAAPRTAPRSRCCASCRRTAGADGTAPPSAGVAACGGARSASSARPSAVRSVERRRRRSRRRRRPRRTRTRGRSLRRATRRSGPTGRRGPAPISVRRKIGLLRGRRAPAASRPTSPVPSTARADR